MPDRYQSSPGTSDGTFDTQAWFDELLKGVSGPLGSVLDVGAAEGVMCLLAAQHGATRVTGFGLHDDRMAEARRLNHPNILIRECEARDWTEPADTIIYSMMAHWLGKSETARFARLADRWFLVIYRPPNEHYQQPINGTWFPTLAELDEVVGGIRTHDAVLVRQDRGKTIHAVTYRVGWQHKPFPVSEGLRALTDAGAPLHWREAEGGYEVKIAQGFDLHGDLPYKPADGKPVLLQGHPAVRKLAHEIAVAALKCGWYPTDFSPRNIVVHGDTAKLIDLEEIEATTGRVGDPYLPIWQATLGDFSGDLGDL